ncbi:MAG: bifunctional proline dehydrogenase/L-glutamate gamma-semialdehyde dehydrogenase PutA [Alphaproteobacteria bacterium]|nr:bifunctional proline dehydrogenase/L-glutamate gamma-semialdehyde dehydrogenase PutA [Alphaproteobacteria bacterium]
MTFFPPDTLSAVPTRDENADIEALLNALPDGSFKVQAAKAKARDLVETIRTRKKSGGLFETFLQDYSLKSQEGLALMSLAEALLRIPDKDTAKALIRDKTAAADWLAAAGGSKGWMAKAAGIGLFAGQKTLDGALSRLGEPVIREAMIQAMRLLGQHFVLGETIEKAVRNAASFEERGYRMSYDVLGEGARTQDDAQRYLDSYTQAIAYLGGRVQKDAPHPPGISVKLSALHPRYVYAQESRCVPEMSERLAFLAEKAASHGLPLTVDAEESERLLLSLRIIETVSALPVLKGWDGFGLAVQAYQKRALPLIDHLADMAEAHGRCLQVRLVKGAYWDSEIKRAQALGLSGYPVFTRKPNTDLSFLACAAKLLAQNERFYPMLATHNAYSAAAILEMARESGADFEFQRLYGMGDGLFDLLLQERRVRASIYAPVGAYEELLPYLVRRLLENGANSSFVNRLLDPDDPVDELVADPVEKIRKHKEHAHPAIPTPSALYAQEKPVGRTNSAGLDLSDPAQVQMLLKQVEKEQKSFDSKPLIGGRAIDGLPFHDILNPANREECVGRVSFTLDSQVEEAFKAASKAFPGWNATPVQERAAALERFAALLEENRAALVGLCIREAGKTIPDALGEVREAVDFCRYYANRARADFGAGGEDLPGITGESNRLSLHGRGVFVCISPWNFPLAIFTGQITAALIAGNSVIAKPAEQTSLIAMYAVQLMHKAGIPGGAINMLSGDGTLGAALVAHKDVAGVAFTGSVEAAHAINRALAAKDGPIVPLIAETGGMNAMIVDSSALPEQVADDVLLSAFGSAGQRCSALRILCLQDDIADKVLGLIEGGMQMLRIGNPGRLSSDIGPVIDEEARTALMRHGSALKGFAKLRYQCPLENGLEAQGFYFAPRLYELERLGILDREVFGPVLHVIRYHRDELSGLIHDINARGYGLTLGIHSRIESFHRGVTAQMRAGNVYVNRSMIGAVVGSQPFGGQGLSGTGPKAGGPHYLPRFAVERALSVNTAAAGGNASLVSLEE